MAYIESRGGVLEMKLSRAKFVKLFPSVLLGLGFLTWFLYGLPEEIQEDRIRRANPGKTMFFQASVTHNVVNNVCGQFFGGELEVLNAAYFYHKLNCHW